MLRGFVILVGTIALAGGLVGLLSRAFPPAAVFVVWGGLIVAGTLWERFRYKPIETTAPDAAWEATGERFIDDATGKPVTVYVQRRTGERKYVSG